MDGNTGRGPGWQAGPQQAGPPSGWPPQGGQSGGWQQPQGGQSGGWQQPPGPVGKKSPLPPIVLAGFGVIGVLVVLIVVVLLTDSGGSGDDGDEPELSAADETTTTAASDDEPDVGSEVETDEPGAALGEEGPAAAGDYTLPDRAGVVSGSGTDPTEPPEIPSEADPPDYEESVMGADVDSMSGWPSVGSVRVDLEPEGYVDIPVHLDAGEGLVMAYVDDDIAHDTEIYGPDGEFHGTIEGTGAEGEFVGWEFVDPPLETAGTYVFRVIHNGGRDDGFVLSFYSAEWEI